VLEQLQALDSAALAIIAFALYQITTKLLVYISNNFTSSSNHLRTRVDRHGQRIDDLDVKLNAHIEVCKALRKEQK